MFAENDIYGNFSSKVDIKNRIVLNKETGREEGQKFVIIDTDEYLEIIEKQQFLIELKKIENLYKQASDIEKEVIKYDLYKKYNSILKITTCDAAGRICFGDDIKFKSDKVYYFGAQDRVVIDKAQLELEKDNIYKKSK